jgi:hypothetical protein
MPDTTNQIESQNVDLVNLKQNLNSLGLLEQAYSSAFPANYSCILAIVTSFSARAQFIVSIEGGEVRNVGRVGEQATKFNSRLRGVHSIPDPSVVKTAT